MTEKSELGMRIGSMLQRAVSRLRAFPKATRGNIGMILGLSLIPLCLAAGAGLDMSRAMITRARMGSALDAAGLAVGANPSLSNDQMKALANEYFRQNYTADPNAYGTPDPVQIPPPSGQTLTLSTKVKMPTVLMRIVGVDTMDVAVSSTITWGQTKLWVALVLDNTGSMCEPPKGAKYPCPKPASTTKIAALQLATHNLLDMLKGAAAKNGDVLVSIVPFSKDVTVGTANVSASWLDWSDWEAEPDTSNGNSPAPSTSVGPGSNCPWTSSSNSQKSPYGYLCVSDASSDLQSTSTAFNVATVPSYLMTYNSSTTYYSGNQVTYSGNNYIFTYSSGKSNKTPSSSSSYWKQQYVTPGMICPGVDGGSYNSPSDAGFARGGHYYNGCYDSVATGYTSAVNGTATVTKLCTQLTTCTTNTYCSNVPGPTTTMNGNDVTTTTTSCACPKDGTKNGKQVYTCSNTAQPSTKTANKWSHHWIVNSHSNWNGCVMDRTQDYDIANTAPTGGARFPTENSDNCPPGVISPLPRASDVSSNDNWTAYWSNLSGQVDAMIANGNTNQGVGLAWGWQTLTNDDPYNPGTLPVDTRKVLILLTDGANTQNRWSTDSGDIDARTKKACQAIKDDGVTVYTVLVMAGSSTMLQGCATDTTKYFALSKPDDIVTTFNQIGTQITNLRVSL